MAPYLQLVRIFLTPTAVADSYAGLMVASFIDAERHNRSEVGAARIAAVVAISVSLYWLGMAANDLFDRENRWVEVDVAVLVQVLGLVWRAIPVRAPDGENPQDVAEVDRTRAVEVLGARVARIDRLACQHADGRFGPAGEPFEDAARRALERGPGDPAVAYDADHDAWLVQVPGLGGRMRVFFDRSTRRPKRVEALAEDGAVVATSDLGRYESVEQTGVAPLDRPKFPTKVDILLPPGGDRVMLAVEGPQSTTNARVFQLDRLIQALRPDRVEEVRPDAADDGGRRGMIEP